MRGPRRPEDLPRLMAALGVDEAGVRAALGPGEPTAREQASWEHWVPTQASLARASRATGAQGRGLDAPTVLSAHAPEAGLGPGTGLGNSTGTGTGTGSGTVAPPAGAAVGVRAGRHRRPRRGPPVATPPTALREARYNVSRRAVVAVLLVALLAAALFVARVELARAAGRPAPVASATGASASGGIVARASSTFGPSTTGPSTGVATSASGTAAAAGSGVAGGSIGGTPGPVVVVHVVGQVRRPGVYTLAAGKRVADAVAAAGGATAHADLGGVDLARPLVDGEQVRVPRPGEVVAQLPGPAAGAGGPPSGGQAGALVNLNTADLAALDTLPGVGPVLAQRILDWRSAHGSFTSVQELGEVSGIGEKMLAQLTPKVSL